MMKKIVILLFVGMIGFAVSAQEKVAKIKFETETIDYGTIEKGANGVRVFEFTNIGDAPLVITKVKSTCGCTVPSWPKAPVMPGETGQIEVKYDTKRLDVFIKTILVTSNAQRPSIALKIKGNVIDPSKSSVLDKKSKSVLEQKQ
tara:strand:- start:984 stop:1418 length:435 start_codon:yes stop_codon:yes gene_type:complete